MAPAFALTTAFTGRSTLGARPAATAVCAAPSVARAAAGIRMGGYDMNGSGGNTLVGRTIKSSGVEKDTRAFKVTFCLPSQSRLYTFRELQNVYTTKVVPFSSWYAEQQRIQKMGGKILKVELASGAQMRSVGNSAGGVSIFPRRGTLAGGAVIYLWNSL
ncbi:hypothetical protein I4F81_005570 [Pyropia yezoensis]|uniref:Uncharacterized protein n=1 Tax=Pyropia yezoensis TaxID=2788 RepID=A0ACC3BYQ3_PYRYE|nr:hypothetical protein I4F81_005570 [Neopyropia yezoensis]